MNMNQLPVLIVGAGPSGYSSPLSDGRNIYDILEGDAFQLILFESKPTLEFDTSVLYSPIHDYLNCHHFHQEKEMNIFLHYQIEKSIIVLVRPDMHIAFVTDNIATVNNYWKDILKKLR